MLQWRIGLFFGAASLAGAFGGALAYGISFMSGTRGLLGWSWIFILVRVRNKDSSLFLVDRAMQEGIATVIVGFVVFFGSYIFPLAELSIIRLTRGFQF